MPVCETCGSPAKKDELELDTAYDRTVCPRCTKTGPVRDEKYSVAVVITDQGIAVTGRAPGLKLSYADSWVDVGARVMKMREQRQATGKLKLVDGTNP